MYRVVFSRPRPTLPNLCCGCGGDPTGEYRPPAGGRPMPICGDCEAMQDSLSAARRRFAEVKAKAKRVSLLTWLIGAVVAIGPVAAALPRADGAGIVFVSVAVGLVARWVARWIVFSSRESVDVRRRFDRAKSAYGDPPVVYLGPADAGEEYLFRCEAFARAIADENGTKCRRVP